MLRQEFHQVPAITASVFLKVQKGLKAGRTLRLITNEEQTIFAVGIIFPTMLFVLAALKPFDQAKSIGLPGG